MDNLAHSQDIDAHPGRRSRLWAQVELGTGWAHVTGPAVLACPAAPVDCCESGSTLRFLIPLAALSGGRSPSPGWGRLMQRPQSVYRELFARRSLRFEQDGGTLTVAGPLAAGEYELAGDVSSQFVSGLLFALPLLDGDSTLRLHPPVESRSYIEMTRAAQALFGVESRWLDAATLLVPGRQRYLPRDITVEGDWSQAAFPAVLGALAGDVTVTGLAADTLQGDAVIGRILDRCGAQRGAEGFRFAKSPLHGVEIDLADCPDPGPRPDGYGAAVPGPDGHPQRRPPAPEGERPHRRHGAGTAQAGRLHPERGRHRVDRGRAPASARRAPQRPQ